MSKVKVPSVSEWQGHPLSCCKQLRKEKPADIQIHQVHLIELNIPVVHLGENISILWVTTIWSVKYCMRHRSIMEEMRLLRSLRRWHISSCNIVIQPARSNRGNSSATFWKSILRFAREGLAGRHLIDYTQVRPSVLTRFSIHLF